MKTNKEIVAYFLHHYEELKQNHISYDILNMDEIEDVVALYAEMNDIFNNVTFAKNKKNLIITVYKVK